MKKPYSQSDDYKVPPEVTSHFLDAIVNLADNPCHRCGRRDFEVPGRVFKIPLVPMKGAGNMVPEPGELVMLTICRHCGSTASHSLRILGIDVSNWIEEDHE